MLSTIPGGAKLSSLLDAITSGYGEELGLLKSDSFSSNNSSSNNNNSQAVGLEASSENSNSRADIKKVVRLSHRNQLQISDLKKYVFHQTQGVPTPLIALVLVMVSFLTWFLTPPTMSDPDKIYTEV
jgi:hypothetical protein